MEGTTGPIENLVDLLVDDKEPSKVLKLKRNLSERIRKVISEFLKQNLEVFSWAHSDMEGIDPSIMSHRLNIHPSKKLIR